MVTIYSSYAMASELDIVEYATRHLCFPYTHKPLGECLYEENTSDKWNFYGIP